MVERASIAMVGEGLVLEGVEIWIRRTESFETRERSTLKASSRVVRARTESK
jgi:hypothetical protein